MSNIWTINLDFIEVTHTGKLYLNIYFLIIIDSVKSRSLDVDLDLDLGSHHQKSAFINYWHTTGKKPTLFTC